MIYLLEDDESIRKLVTYTLQHAGYEAAGLSCPSAFWAAMKRQTPELVLLDIMLPEEDGLSVLKKLRGSALWRELPVVMLTAKNAEYDRVVGLDAGADDYITNPFSLAILRARVNAQLRRRVKFSCVELDGFRFDFERMAFWKNGEPIELSKTEQKLLRLLVENRGQTVSRGVLVDRIWTDGADFVDENALSVTVKRLRGKLEDDPSSPQYLKTVYGLGYTWAVK